MRKLVLSLLLSFPAYLYAQHSITGKIVSAANGRPIPFASVFLSNSRIGNKTDKDGSFILKNIKNGRYQFVVSCIGYNRYQQSVSINDNDLKIPVIKLTDKIGELGEVKIKFESKSDREKYLRIFKKAFLGTTYNAGHCKIVNPDIIDFEYSKKRQQLSASTSDFLIIDNNALGYRIRYLVYSFISNDTSGVTNYVGVSSFEPMHGNAIQQKVWQNRRAKAYFGSAMHFLRSCIADAVSENKFTIRVLIKPKNRPSDSLILTKIRYFRSPFREAGYVRDSIAYWEMMYKTSKTIPSAIDRALSLKEFIKLTNEKGIYAFGHPLKVLFINYKNRINIVSRRSSFVTFLKPNVFFDSNGVIFTPGDCLFEGYWQDLRVGDQLPVDYELPRENAEQETELP